MTCRDCIYYNGCAKIINAFLAGQYPNWESDWYVDCEEFDEALINYSEDTAPNEPTEDVEALTNVSEDTAAAGSTMDEVGAQLINLYAEYSRMTGYLDVDYAKAVCIAVRMLSD